VTPQVPSLEEPRSHTGPGGVSRRSDALHVFVLFSLALAQPLLSVLSESAHFFVASRAEAPDLLLLVLIVCAVPPAAVVALEWLTGLVSERLRTAAHTLVVALLVAAIGLPFVKGLAGFSPASPLAAAGVLGAAGALAYRRLRAARLFLSYLAVGLVEIPANFLFNTGVSKLLLPSAGAWGPPARRDPGRADVPVVVAVFDELPTSSLMNERGEIDADTYPNFASLARQAYWFRNATSVGDTTLIALPAILSGRYPRPTGLPVAEDYPNNLFTFLGRTHRLTVVESGTHLCPDALCGNAPPPLPSRLASMLADVALVYPFVVLPAELTAGMPSVTHAWNDFAATAAPPPRKAPGAAKAELTAKFTDLLKATDRHAIFARFVDGIDGAPGPRLYFVHSLIPHYPWQYLPSGKAYGPDIRSDGLERELWADDEWAVIQGYQRHLLQAAFSDTLLGMLLAKLRSVGLYDRSLLVVLADHGSSYRRGDSRRKPTATNYADLIAVPLLIKRPHQRDGVVSDRNVQTIDLLPTIADVLGIPLPWPVGGRSMFGGSAEPREKRLVSVMANATFAYPARVEQIYDTAASKLALLGPGVGVDRLYGMGPYRGLLGRRVADLAVAGEDGPAVAVEAPSAFADLDPDADVLPARITGLVRAGGRDPGRLTLAVAVNGTVRAVTRTYANDARTLRFSALVPEASFRAGDNAVEVLAVSGDEQHPRLVRTVPLP
jgi:hypothetical protein